MCNRTARDSRRRSGGFTLIELLVVVAIIALLISILLPSLSSAREQGKTTKCLANLKAIGTAMASYFSDENEWFPFEKDNYRTVASPMMHGFYYGGHPGRVLPNDPTNWWGYVRPRFRDTPRGRPFNSYMYSYSELPDWDIPAGDPLFDKVRDMPIFRCPSDTGGFWNTSSDEYSYGRQLYWECGSSYDENYHFALSWAIYGQNGLDKRHQWQHRANAFLRVQMQLEASRFIIIYEDPFDSAQWLNIPRRGWHTKWNRHNLLFLDGHAANMLTDTTKGNRGTGWKSSSCSGLVYRRWFEDPNDPDYELKDIAPLPPG